MATIVGEGAKTLVEITVDTTTQVDAGTLGEGELPDGPSRPGPMVLGDAIVATDGHPFWVPLLGEWVDAVDLVPGMWFLSSEGTLVQITGTRTWTESERVYNLTVQDLHTYYVRAGEIDLLSHNCQFSARAEQIWMAEPDEYVRKNVNTVAVVRAGTPSGHQVDLISGAGDGLTPGQMSVPLPKGEMHVPNIAETHADQNIFLYMQANGYSLIAGGTSRNVCRNRCHPWIREFGGAMRGPVFDGSGVTTTRQRSFELR